MKLTKCITKVVFLIQLSNIKTNFRRIQDDFRPWKLAPKAKNSCLFKWITILCILFIASELPKWAVRWKITRWYNPRLRVRSLHLNQLTDYLGAVSFFDDYLFAFLSSCLKPLFFGILVFFKIFICIYATFCNFFGGLCLVFNCLD